MQGMHFKVKYDSPYTLVLKITDSDYKFLEPN